MQFKEENHLLNTIIRVTLWHDPLIGEKVFLGQVNLAIGSITTPSWNHSGWYWLCPRPVTPAQACRPDIGSLRVKIQYSKDIIYPLKVYDMLSEMLVESTVSSVSLFAEACTLYLTCILTGVVRHCTLHVGRSTS